MKILLHAKYILEPALGAHRLEAHHIQVDTTQVVMKQ